jgi:hypothetical protein
MSPAEDAYRQKEDGSQQLEYTLHRDPDQPERQQQKPHYWVQDER